MTAGPFPSSYAEARGAFLDEARAAGATIESYVHPQPGPGGEELATDVARFGDAGARRVLVIGSGTHGVEGRAGSGIQRALVADGAIVTPPPGTAVVIPINDPSELWVIATKPNQVIQWIGL